MPVQRPQAAAAARSCQSCPTQCDPIDSSPPGSPVPGILQARTLEWGAISFMHACMLICFSCLQLCVTPWTAAHQAPLSTGFSRQEHWSGLPFPSPRDPMRTPKTHQKYSFQLSYLSAYIYGSLGAFHNVSTPKAAPSQQHSLSVHEAHAQPEHHQSKVLPPQHGATCVCHLRCEQHLHLRKLHQLSREGA